MSTFEERALRRASWAVRVVPLGDEPLSDPSDTSTVDERLAWVAQLTREQWAFGNLELPTYTRAEMPGRMFRRAR